MFKDSVHSPVTVEPRVVLGCRHNKSLQKTPQQDCRGMPQYTFSMDTKREQDQKAGRGHLSAAREEHDVGECASPRAVLFQSQR